MPIVKTQSISKGVASEEVEVFLEKKVVEDEVKDEGKEEPIKPTRKKAKRTKKAKQPKG